jgi:TatD DNase family protein
MEFVDTHAHIYSEEFVEDKVEVIQRAKDAGVGKIVLPAIDSNTHQQQLDLTAQHPQMLYSLMGLHPTSVNDGYRKELDIVEKHLANGGIYGVGEVGIDLYWDKTHYKEQLDAFTIQTQWAIEANLPLIIHTRDSFDEVYNALYPLMTDDLTGIFHCFSGSANQAKQVVDMGFYIGVGGVYTFKNSNLREELKEIDINHIVLETDSPYLAPVPKRGKRNEPAYVVNVAGLMAEQRGMSLEQIATITSRNADKIFQFTKKQ